MKQSKAELVNLRLAHAKKTMQEVDIQIENSLWNVAVNRLYYACFYAVTALLHQKDLDAKTHKGAQRMLSLHFTSTGIISPELGDLYTNLLDMRQDADYEDTVEYEEDDVMKLRQPAADLISEIERILARG